MTLQDAFNAIWLRSKTKVKSLHNGVCHYRSEGNLPCFAGVLISDQHYSASLEHKSVRNDLVKDAIRFSGYPESKMYRSAQEIHDYSKVEDWEDKLRQLAKFYSLTVPE